MALFHSKSHVFPQKTLHKRNKIVILNIRRSVEFLEVNEAFWFNY